jgi:hypothetical protein
VRRRRASAEPLGLSLVALADSLTSTFCVVLFIAIFTLLTAGGAVIAKRLPMEQDGEQKPFEILVSGGRVVPLREDLVRTFLDPLGRPEKGRLNDWLEAFNARRLEDDQVIVEGQGRLELAVEDGRLFQQTDLTLAVRSRPGAGETARELERPESRLQKHIRGFDPAKRFVFFLVRPDSIEAFAAAREQALRRGFASGWAPLDPTDPLRFSLSGRGFTGKHQ